jgi:hypothetical protein
MFGLFRSKKKSGTQEDFGTQVAKTLFGQIEQARDEAKAGGIVDEKVFNDRLNAMYVAGYLIGYVDTHIAQVTDNDVAKREYAESIFESMFPGAGMEFIKEKLAIRTKAKNMATDDSSYPEVAERCHAFDTGMADAEDEVDSSLRDTEYQPVKLKEFLLLGER